MVEKAGAASQMKSFPAVERDTKENLERRQEFLRINGRTAVR
jgi:hypothetical protein